MDAFVTQMWFYYIFIHRALREKTLTTISASKIHQTLPQLQRGIIERPPIPHPRANADLLPLTGSALAASAQRKTCGQLRSGIKSTVTATMPVSITLHFITSQSQSQSPNTNPSRRSNRDNEHQTHLPQPAPHSIRRFFARSSEPSLFVGRLIAP